MQPGEIIAALRRHRVAAVAVLGAALAAAVLAGYHVSLFPPKLTTRTVSSGAATAQILIDAPASTLANLKQDTLPLTTRAGVFAQYMASAAVRDDVAQTLGIPAAAITTQGPFSGAGEAYNTVPPATARDLQIVDQRKRYRLQFIAQQDLPLVTVYATGPDAASAARLAGAVNGAVRRSLAGYVSASADPAKRRVVVRALGPPQTGTVTSGGGKLLMGLAFTVVLLAGCGLILFVDRRRQAPVPDAAWPGPSGAEAEHLRLAQLDRLQEAERAEAENERSDRVRLDAG